MPQFIGLRETHRYNWRPNLVASNYVGIFRIGSFIQRKTANNSKRKSQRIAERTKTFDSSRNLACIEEEMATFTEEQFQLLVAKMTATQQANKKGSFSTCTARFSGQRDPLKVEEFIATINVYKDIEAISDAEAVRGLPLLLEDNAVTWWQGIKDEAVTWNDAIKLLRNAFAPLKPAYRIYIEIFEERQSAEESTDNFICKKRALLSQLPEPKHSETVMLD